MSEPRPLTGATWWQRTRSRVTWRMTAWLVVLWVILRADLTLVTVLIGALLALALQLLFPMPHLGVLGRVRPLWVLVLLGHFLGELVWAAVQVSWLILRRRPPDSRVMIVPLRSQSPLFLTIGAALTSLVPGTSVIDAHLRPATVHLHVLDLPSAGGVEGVHLAQLRLEDRILWAFGTPKELQARAIPRRGRYSPCATTLSALDPDLAAHVHRLRKG